MKNWLSTIPLKTVFSLLPNDLKQKSSLDCLEELPASSEKNFARKRFYKLNSTISETIHLTYGPMLDHQYENSKALHEAIPAFTCKPLFIKNKDEYSLFGQEFFEGEAIDDLYNDSKIDKSEVTKILEKVHIIFQNLEKPSSIESAKEEFKGFCKTILENNLFSEADFKILEHEIFPLISSWIEKANLTFRWSQGDLSARNFLVNKKKDFKIIDYEFACKTHFHEEDWLRLGNFSKGKFCEHPFVVNALKESTLAINLFHLLRQICLNSLVHTSKDYIFYLKKDLFDIVHKTSNLDKNKSFFLKSLYTYYDLLTLSLDKEKSHNDSLKNENNSLKKFELISEQKILKLSSQLKISNQQIDELKSEVTNSNQEIDELKSLMTSADAKIIKLSNYSLELQKKLELREDKISRMQHSFSWKITEPLRFLRRQKEKLFQPTIKFNNPLDFIGKSSPSKLKPSNKPVHLFSPFESEDNFSKYPLADSQDCKLSQEVLKFIWLIPDFGIGSGGHTTIFRMIMWLESFGHKSTILICGGTHHGNAQKAKDIITSHFFPLNASVDILTDPNNLRDERSIIVSTSYDTCYFSRNVDSPAPRYYFVQDYEPEFSSLGSYYYLAKNTYLFGFNCITAGKWLSNKITSVGGKVSGYFELAVDKEIFFPNASIAQNHKTLPLIAVYSRSATPRRMTELVIYGLNLLSRRGCKFKVVFFGDSKIPVQVCFQYEILGVIPPITLAELYRSADIGCVFSGTNYSLVPLEMMACGLPIVEFDGPNTRETFPKASVRFAKPDPISIADEIQYLLTNSEKNNHQISNALEFTKVLSWEKSARKFEKIIKNELVAQSQKV